MRSIGIPKGTFLDKIDGFYILLGVSPSFGCETFKTPSYLLRADCRSKEPLTPENNKEGIDKNRKDPDVSIMVTCHFCVFALFDILGY